MGRRVSKRTIPGELQTFRASLGEITARRPKLARILTRGRLLVLPVTHSSPLFAGPTPRAASPTFLPRQRNPFRHEATLKHPAGLHPCQHYRPRFGLLCFHFFSRYGHANLIVAMTGSASRLSCITAREVLYLSMTPLDEILYRNPLPLRYLE